MMVLWSRPSTKVLPASAPPRWAAWSPLRLRLHRSAPVAMSCATIRPSRLTYTVSSPKARGSPRTVQRSSPSAAERMDMT